MSPSYVDRAVRAAVMARTLAGSVVAAVHQAARRMETVAKPSRAENAGLSGMFGVAAQVYRILVVLDIERFGDPRRDDQLRIQLRRALFETVERALRGGGVSPALWEAWGTGDGLLLLVQPAAETARVLRALLDRLPDEIASYNRLRVGPACLRTRAVLHTGHLMLDEHGALGQEIIRVFRVLDADPLRTWLELTSAPVVVAVSEDVYRQVVYQRALGLDPAHFQLMPVEVKETRAYAWVYARERTAASGPHPEQDPLPDEISPGGPFAA
jgi:hypothetical protein